MTTANGENTIMTAFGRFIDLWTPRVDTIDIHDIAHSLGMICRFGGHIRRFYSVAQHSILVSHLVKPELQMAGLLHDAAEAYLGDVTRPLKRLLPEYQQLEREMETVITTRFELDDLKPPEVAEADMTALVTEAKELCHQNWEYWRMPASVSYTHLTLPTSFLV